MKTVPKCTKRQISGEIFPNDDLLYKQKEELELQYVSLIQSKKRIYVIEK